MRAACDLAVSPAGVQEAEAMAETLSRLGYSCVGVEAGRPEVLEAFRRHGLEAYKRVTIEASRWSEASRKLRRVEADIVVVVPGSAEVARNAARHPRVSMVRIVPRMARYMDMSEASLLASRGAAVELYLRPLLRRGDPRRTLRGLMIVARRAAAYEAALVATSGATTRWELWPPYTVRGLLVSFGLPETVAALSITSYPRAVLAQRWRR